MDRLAFGPLRRRRRMHRLLRELDRADAGPRSYSRPRGELRRQLTAYALAIGLALTVGVIFANKQFGVAVSMDGLQRRGPLGIPPAVVTGVGSFQFSMTQPTDPSRPVTYDPCRPIEYEVNDALAPDLGQRITEDAIATIETATGLDFRYIGTSNRSPSTEGRSPWGGREPVIIGWTTVDAVPELRDRVAGVGGSTARKDGYTGDLEYVTGLVALDAPQLKDILARPDGEAQVQAIVTHEIAHLVGLDHVEDPNELMYSNNIGRYDLGPGDREGLAALGSGRCY